MTTSEFLESFTKIEEQLRKSVGTEPEPPSFSDLTQLAEKQAILSKDLIIMVNELIHFRNRLVSNPTGIEINSEIINQIQNINLALNI